MFLNMMIEYIMQKCTGQDLDNYTATLNFKKIKRDFDSPYHSSDSSQNE